MPQIQNNQQSSGQNYYTNKKRKIADFLIGLLGVAIAYFIWYFAAGFASTARWLNFFPILLNFLFWPTLIAVIVLAARAKRKFIIWGIAIAYLIPFLLVALLFGMCAFGAIKW